MTFPLAGLHIDILMQILFKMSWRSLATVRQTFSHLSYLVEQHRKQFAKNTNEDICLEVAIGFNSKGKLELSYSIEIGHNDIELHDPVNQLSAIQISELEISCDISIDDLEDKENETHLIAELVEVLQKLSISPEDAFVKAKSNEEKKKVILSNTIHDDMIDDSLDDQTLMADALADLSRVLN